MKEPHTRDTNYHIEYYDSYYKEWKRTSTNNRKLSTLEEALLETKSICVNWRILKEDLISTVSVVAEHISNN